MIIEVHHKVDQPHELSSIINILDEVGFNVLVNNYHKPIDFRTPFKRKLERNADQYIVINAWQQEI